MTTQNEIVRSYDIVKGGIYEHFKGERYEVLDIVLNAETDERMVLYRRVANPDISWVRSVFNFRDRIERDGVLIPRFKLVEEPKES